MKFDYSEKDCKNICNMPLFLFIYNTDNYFHFLYDSLPYLISYLHIKNDIPELNTGTYSTVKLTPKEGGSKDRCSAFMAIGNYTQDGKICCAHNSFDDFLSGQTIRFIMNLIDLI